MTNVPIGGPWQILAADILEVTISHLYNGYLLVIMDYFTKWTEPIPLRSECCIHINCCLKFAALLMLLTLCIQVKEEL